MSKNSSLFTEVPVRKVPRNLFDLSHEVKMSGKFGYLYPVLVMDCLPGDTVRDVMAALVRIAPMVNPIMHTLTVKTDFFFVPNRLVWSNWENFITGGQAGNLAPSFPHITPAALRAAVGDSSRMRKGSMWDYLGLPVLEGADPGAFGVTPISALPFKAMAKIYNDYYRDPNVDTELTIAPETDGQQAAAMVANGMFSLRQRGWERDYFTAALPWAQRGSTVLLPLSTTVPSTSITYRATPLISRGGGLNVALGDFKTSVSAPLVNMQDSANNFVSVDNIDSINVTNANTSINDFRRGLAIQAWMENNARGGARYIEQIQAHFQVRVPDYRLQRAEYLGGGRQRINISEVLSTADSGVGEVGDMAGHGVAFGKSNRFTYRCQEHGYIIGVLSVVPKTSYDQGIERHMLRIDKFDFAFPELAHLGEQMILNREIFFSFSSTAETQNGSVFGYIPRYAEYKFKNDRIAGDFRDTLADWHLSRIFTALPVLDGAFMRVNENTIAGEEGLRRIFYVQDGTDYLWMQLYHNLTAKRPLPYFGVPNIVG